jgi:cobalt transporter subunit CbtA
MVLRLFFAAFAAGIIAGLGVTALQQVTTAPLIHKAETFEKAGARPATGSAHGHTGAGPAAKNAIERIAYTALTNIILGVGFALLLVGCFALYGQPVTGPAGVLWGLAGFAVFTLGPAAGLPPELPGMAAGELSGRQVWWLLAAACTAGGLWLLVLKRPIAAKIGGIALLAMPSIIGAPHPEMPSNAVPPELASRFAAMSIIVSAIFWAALGWLAGTFHQRFAKIGKR